jgi:hypothetical protein
MALTVQLSYSFNGLTFGGIGQDVQVLTASGVRGTPNMRTADAPWPMDDGDAPGVNTLDERVMQFALQVMGHLSQPFETVMQTLATAFVPVQNPTLVSPLQCYLDPSWPEAKQCMARVTAATTPIDNDYSHQIAKPNVQFTAADPLWYSSTLHSVSTGLPSPTAGLTYPVTYDVPFGASSGGSASVTNAGNYATAPLITITGPCTNPYVSLGSATMKLNLTLGVSDVVVIDMAAMTVTLNGADRQNAPAFGSAWWSIPVGTYSVGVGSSDSAAVAALFTIQWRDAWSNL